MNYQQHQQYVSQAQQQAYASALNDAHNSQFAPPRTNSPFVPVQQPQAFIQRPPSRAPSRASAINHASPSGSVASPSHHPGHNYEQQQYINAASPHFNQAYPQHAENSPFARLGQEQQLQQHQMQNTSVDAHTPNPNWLRQPAHAEQQQDALRHLQASQMMNHSRPESAASIQRPYSVQQTSQPISHASPTGPLGMLQNRQVQTPAQQPQPQQQPQTQPNQAQPPQAQFAASLRDFYAQIQKPIPQIQPIVENRQLDLFRFFQVVNHFGGYNVCSASKIWHQVAQILGFPPPASGDHRQQPPERLAALMEVYRLWLLDFETHLRTRKMPQTSAPMAQQPTQVQSQPAFSQPARSASAISAQSQPAMAMENRMFSQPEPSQPQSTDAAAAILNRATQVKPAALDAQSPATAPLPLAPNGSAAGDVTVNAKEEQSASQMTNTNTNTSAAANLSTVLPIQIETPPRPTTASNNEETKTRSMPQGNEQPTKKRKFKVEYVPQSKPLNLVGIHRKTDVETVASRSTLRSMKTAQDLGAVHLAALMLSLRSGIPSEVVPALNTLNMLAQASRSDGYETAFFFDLRQAPELVDILLDIVEDTAFPKREDDTPSPHRSLPPETYASHLAAMSETKCRRRFAKARMRPEEANTILSIINTLRSLVLSIVQDRQAYHSNAPYILSHARFLDLLLRLCDFVPDSTDKDGRPLRSTIVFNLADLLVIRKDVLAILAECAFIVDLENQPHYVVRSIFRLVTFFLSSDPAVALVPDAQVPNAQPTLIVEHQNCAAICAFAQVAAKDSHRAMFAPCCDSQELLQIWETLSYHLPMDQDGKMQVLQNPDASQELERVAACLLNVVMMAPSDTQKQISKSPTVSLLARLVTEFLPIPSAQTFCFFVLELLNALRQVVVPSRTNTKLSLQKLRSNGSFFGGGFMNTDSEDDTMQDVHYSEWKHSLVADDSFWMTLVSGNRIPLDSEMGKLAVSLFAP